MTTSLATPALVIGGGLAGAAVAARLASAGHFVTVIERETQAHHKVCGEFISAEAALYLQDLGLALESLGAATIDRICLGAGERRASAPLPFAAFSLSRRLLDEALLAKAAACGAEIIRGSKIVGLRREGRFWQATVDDGGHIAAQEVFLATGKHELKGWIRPAGLRSDFIGFKLHWRLTGAAIHALRSAVELILFPGGYAGLELVENDVANLCLIVRKQGFFARGQSWQPFFASLLRECPQLRRRLADAEPCWPRPLAISAVPYGFTQRQADGLWRLGDQAACIPSLSGDGMAIALHSAFLAAHYFLKGQDATTFQTRLAQDIARHVHRTTWLAQMLVHPWGQKAGVTIARRLPLLLTAAAGATRIPHSRVKEVRSRDLALSGPMPASS